MRKYFVYTVIMFLGASAGCAHRTGTSAEQGNRSESERSVQRSTAEKPAGFVIYDIQPGSVYDLLGLKNGDVITSINNDSEINPEKMSKIFSEPQKRSKLTIKVLRNGKKKSFTYEVR